MLFNLQFYSGHRLFFLKIFVRHFTFEIWHRNFLKIIHDSFIVFSIEWESSLDPSLDIFFPIMLNWYNCLLRKSRKSNFEILRIIKMTRCAGFRQDFQRRARVASKINVSQNSFDGEIEVCVLLDGRDGRLYASALPNSSCDFSAGWILDSRLLSPSRRSSASSFYSSLFFSRFRPVHNWFPSSACRSFDEFFKVQRGRSDEELTDAISVSSTLCPSPFPVVLATDPILSLLSSSHYFFISPLGQTPFARYIC